MPTNQFTPTVVYHPAETLREKLSEMGIDIKEFALRTGIPEKTFIAVLNEENQLTPEMAELFENVTKIPAGFWINKQARYNEYIAGENRKHTILQ
jgi:HTH-type transcriptional regulator/antitoxin HigA